MKYPRTRLGLLWTAVLLPALNLPTALADDKSQATNLEPIVVTANLGPETAGESLSSVTVVRDEEIRRQESQEFKDLLRGQPGIDIVSNGSFGKNTSVFARGTSNDSTVFLVDGVRLRSATSGGAPWQYFPLKLAERVEIVRGPRSALYGSDAVGSVIQAFTLNPADGGRSGWIEAGAGNFDTQEVSGGVSVSGDSTRLSLSGLHKESDGTSIFEDGEDKGFRNSAGVGRLTHEFSRGGEASLVMVQSEGNSQFDGGNTDFMVRTLGLNLETPVSDYWLTSIQLSESADEQENFRDSGDSVFDTKSRDARWLNTVTLGVHEFVMGGELRVDEVDGSIEFVETSRTNAALFGQLRLNFGPTDLNLSLRGDDNEAYGKQETGGIALGHSFDRSHRLRLSYGTAFRAPTFNDLYYPLETFSFGGTYAGNPNLEPETSSAVELGFGGRYTAWYWDAAIYQTNVDDLIELQTTGGDTRPVNVSEAEIQGFELATGFSKDQWDLGLRLTLVDPRDEETDNRLRRRSHQSLRLDVDRALGDWSVGATFAASGYRYNDEDNEERLPGFGTLDLRAGWNFAEDWNARLSLQNVTDKRYSTALRFDGEEYLTAGTTGFFSIRRDFHGP
ncbi:TonB-dependent receptor domain-containing protein [Marinobacter confluentis]|uniref:TonB-dependent receptor n=1 Tax=Marinobacter confluentis TaxID=1697557 RepID=A0A4Z1C045_9GAMM|nr:TonB-dependent receptor [Marinobacter confluentis]TGN39313.1 TonB-dependent receptor [Marinobacter confluentis]